ncbi:uncharacterized protein blow [Drosophila tropicalis]|uniref:uncharacterized protein blow n=1 Tax=Drosophila tropicalis TaxID=46794 RepID=UPI0035ABB469
MDTNAKPTKATNKGTEIEQFLLDVRKHFRASLETSEYENTSNLFHVTAADQTLELLERCELLLAAFAYGDEQATSPVPVIKSNGNGFDFNLGLVDCVDSKGQCADMAGSGTGCYQEMLSSPSSSSSKNSLSASREYIDLSSTGSLESDKTFRYSQKTMDPAVEHYDICQSTTQNGDTGDETQQVIMAFSHELIIDCPYADLPAGHLALQRSTKYGQLQRIVPKRLFFDQTRKLYCGILNHWMLSYADGPTACRPSNSLYLKSSSIEIEHFGEGKRREICFQIITDDPNKKFVYQANNEVDAKEWIHAIEAAIRGDAHNATQSPTQRKLPTPPVTKKPSIPMDSIYEEPTPIFNTPPKLPERSHSPNALAKRFEYDIPKCPPQPLAEIEFSCSTSPSTTPHSDFQAKVKSVHSELSSQLSPTGPSPERLKKAVKKSYSCGSNSSEAEMISLTSTSPPTTPTTPSKEQKKQRKSQMPPSPQQSPGKDGDKLARSWFLSRLNKTAGIKLSNTSTGSGNGSGSTDSANAKCKQSEKENLLNELDFGESNLQSPPSPTPSSPCAKSKVNMIINQFENSGHLSTMFSVEALAANALASLTSFCEGDNCNNYEPISSFLKKV